jgi:hypothetical protein
VSEAHHQRCRRRDAGWDGRKTEGDMKRKETCKKKKQPNGEEVWEEFEGLLKAVALVGLYWNFFLSTLENIVGSWNLV